MKTIPFVSFLSCTMFFFSVFIPHSIQAKTTRSTWKKIGKSNGVTVHQQKRKGSPLFSFRGEATANVHIGKIIRRFLDPESRKFWVDRYHASKALSVPSPFERSYWIRFDLPWPISDRDYVLHVKGKKNTQSRTFTAFLKSVKHKSMPQQKCCVRAIAKRTFYQFKALPFKQGDKGGPRTQLIVEVSTDPKGWLPSWLVNSIQKKWPSKTLSKLIESAKHPNTSPHPEFVNWHQTNTTEIITTKKEVQKEASKTPSKEASKTPTKEASKTPSKLKKRSNMLKKDRKTDINIGG